MSTKKSYPQVTVAVVNYNGKKWLRRCLSSLANLAYPKENLEVLVVDNGSEDGSVTFICRNHPWVKVLTNDQNNFARACNLAMRQARGTYVAFLNNDAAVEKKWLAELVKVAVTDPKIAAVGSKILLEDGRINSAGHRPLPSFYWEDKGFQEQDLGQYDRVTEAESLSGCAVMYNTGHLKISGSDNSSGSSINRQRMRSAFRYWYVSCGKAVGSGFQSVSNFTCRMTNASMSFSSSVSS